MVEISGLERSIGEELGLIVQTPEHIEKLKQEYYAHHNWFWRKLKKSFRDPPKYPYEGKKGAVIIPDMPIPNAIQSLWGTIIGIRYSDNGNFDHPNAIEGIGTYTLIPREIEPLGPTDIITVRGTLVIDPDENITRDVTVYTTANSTRAANIHYLLNSLTEPIIT